MRRWNGWGHTDVSYPLPDTTAAVLAERVGPGSAPRDALLAEVAASVPPSRLPPHPLVSTEPELRIRHARGQSFPDLIVLRSGRVPAFPDGVAFPRSAEDVRALLSYAREVGARLIPYGGGTSVVGHVNVEPGDAPVLTVSLERLQQLHSLSEEDRLATFGAGISGPRLEQTLNVRGYTLGHFPQSFELSTLGGWIVTRSRGQQSLGYGRIENLFAGGRLESPAGTMMLPSFPASATGPDLREFVLGSEGRLGILTEATVRITPTPEREDFHALFFPDWERARTAVRELVQSGAALSMLRLSTAQETAIHLALSGHPRMVGLLSGALALRGVGAEGCMLMLGVSGSERAVEHSRRTALGIAGRHGGVRMPTLGQKWRKGRFRAPYLRNAAWERGWGLDTVETATSWSNLPRLLAAVESALREALADRGERVLAFTHLSHVYPTGSNLYTTFVFRLGHDADDTHARWLALKTAASRAMVAHGGTISHQHGVGTDHRPWLEAEKGQLGISAIRQMFGAFDPTGLLNPGKLV
ncbi:FAD-binding oxidoreductase [Vitiosangium sp. GDMCC 1.1324]|uniref:FAD-binding oxidoreductase n=1 Tax=Vitiosangium sp. (strain GDMCC 1.1324) TaxID=2138576 RepID=UPI000D3859C0|nr:FAD-binding oxidoreductase [Vitiosangium sp. GDMCC 1.1324]PTL78616.1 FAD-binding oxidoreductase [Vitiosangium sp. GDMCC 1.1324]